MAECGSCAAARARRLAEQARSFTWTKDDGTTQVFTGKYAEIQAKHRVKKYGGSYSPT